MAYAFPTKKFDLIGISVLRRIKKITHIKEVMNIWEIPGQFCQAATLFFLFFFIQVFYVIDSVDLLCC